ncbi:MAG: ABC transporter ATP-binding protein/permease [Lachnospiraceae bacterium]|nr:ABC transporter ATP-binding protein/permease [Lachnospiraceae bacterium]
MSKETGMKKCFKMCIHLIGQTMHQDKTVIIKDILIGLIREARSMANIFLPAAILSLIVSERGTNRALLAAAGVNVVLVLLGVILEQLKWDNSIRASKVVDSLLWGLNRKEMDIDYAQTEQSENMQAFYVARDSIWNVDDVHHMLFNVIFSKIITLLVTFLVFTSVHILAAAAVVITVVLEYLVNVLWVSKKEYATDKEISRLGPKRRYVDDILFDQKAMRDMIFNSSRSFLLQKRGMLTGKMVALKKEKADTDFVESTITAALSFIRTLIVFLIAMGRYLSGSLPISSFLVFTGAAQEMTYGLFQISDALSYIRRAAHYYEDYSQYMNLPQTNDTGTLPLPNRVHEIEFQDVSFRYQNREEEALSHVSFRMKTDETIAIVGENGAGKSTLVRLLLRLDQVTQGDILLDGKSIYEYSYEEYIRHWAPVFQDFNLYSFTVGENVGFDREHDEEKLYQILDKVGLRERVESLSEGLATAYSKRFDENGVVFSGGQEQKLAIARAYAKGEDASLILDEPTAALDPLTEYEINRLIAGSSSENFVIFISHRLNTTRFADRILVLDQGRLIEEGSHEELMGKMDGLYREMFLLQSSLYRK